MYIIPQSTEELSDLGEEISELILDNKLSSKGFFLDNEKNKIRYRILMINYLNFGALPERTDTCCFWCRHCFDTPPIGIPLKYICKDKRWEYTKDQMKEYDDYFETDGIFCGFACMQAFLRDNNHDIKYKDSGSLLYIMYRKIYKSYNKIQSAPHWRMLKAYGGFMNIEQFRNKNKRGKYFLTQNIKRPFMFPIGVYAEEN